MRIWLCLKMGERKMVYRIINTRNVEIAFKTNEEKEKKIRND